MALVNVDDKQIVNILKTQYIHVYNEIILKLHDSSFIYDLPFEILNVICTMMPDNIFFKLRCVSKYLLKTVSKMYIYKDYVMKILCNNVVQIIHNHLPYDTLSFYDMAILRSVSQKFLIKVSQFPLYKEIQKNHLACAIYAHLSIEPYNFICRNNCPCCPNQKFIIPYQDSLHYRCIKSRKRNITKRNNKLIKYKHMVYNNYGRFLHFQKIMSCNCPFCGMNIPSGIFKTFWDLKKYNSMETAIKYLFDNIDVSTVFYK